MRTLTFLDPARQEWAPWSRVRVGSGKNGQTVSCKSSAQSASSVCASCYPSYIRTEPQCVDGAALFYTTPLPDTLQVLRQYALHLLFMPPAPSPAMAGSEAPAPVRNPFPFQHKPNALDRDRIVVPVGWDSWGKISVLRDGFDAKTWGEAWERDLDRDEAETEPGAKKMYAALVPDQGAKVRILESPHAFALTTISTATATTSFQQSHTRTSVPRQKLRRELEEAGPRPSGCVPKPQRECLRRYRRAYG